MYAVQCTLYIYSVHCTVCNCVQCTVFNCVQCKVCNCVQCTMHNYTVNGDN